MQARIELPPDVTSPRLARRLMTAVLRDWGIDDDRVEIAVLLVDELVTNALLHAGSPIEIGIASRGRSVRVTVGDRSQAGLQRRRHSADATTGRGLGLVETLATDWGSGPTAAGKEVWFELLPAAGSTR